jgi:8-amino-7-oxononanoate synthase
MSLEEFAAAKLAALTEKSLRRDLVETTRTAGAIVWRNGRRLISFSCNDYLNLSTHPAIIEAAVAATRLYGAGAGASRAVTGNHPLYAELESRLAALKGTQACLVFGSGYLANSGIIPALMGKDDVIFADELSHACIWAGAKLAQSTVITFAHNSMAQLAALLTTHRATGVNALIVTDSVFSMDGDLAPIGTLADLAQKHDCWLLTDDAHGLGVVPRNPDANRVDLQMGTLSKAVGGYGGYVCASAQVVAFIRNRARSYIYTTGLPPGTIAAAVAALDFIAANPDYAGLPLAKAKRFTRALGLPEAVSPIVPLIIGSAEAALAASERLADKGFLVAAIRPPTVPAGTARLRLTFCAAHEDQAIDDLAACIRETVLVPA